MLPDINAAVISLALLRCVRSNRGVLALVVEVQAAAADAIVFRVLSNILDTAFREVFVVSLRSIGVRIADELERGIRMSLSDSNEVLEFLGLGSQRRVNVGSEVNAVNIIVVVDVLRYGRRLNNRSNWLWRWDRSR